MRKLVVVSGLPIDDLNMEEALDRLADFVEIGRETDKTHQVATVNADFVVKAIKDPELRYLLQDADMATADGMPLVWGARILGVSLEGRVAGSDMIPALAERAAQKGYSIYFFGAAPGVAQAAADKLKEQYPDLKIAGVMSPPYSSVLDMDRAILDEIKAAKPDILLVALGNPKQEKFIGMYGRELGIPVMIGIGATLDFIAGNVQRAPEWMQNSGLEWLYRLLQEPGRMWKRYVVDMFGFNLFFLRQWWAMRRGQTVAPLLPTTTDLVMIDGTAVLNVKGRVDMGNHTELNKQVQEIFTTTPDVILNLEETEFLDSSAIGTLVALSKQAHDAGGELKLAALSAPVQQTLSLLRLDKFFDIYEDVNVALGMSVPKTAVVQEPAPQAKSKWRVVKMPRRLDAETAPDVRVICVPMLEEDPCLVIDLANTAFLASAGLALLADLNRVATDLGGELRVAGYSDDVYRVMEMVRFDKVLTLYGDVNAAMA